MHLKWAYPYFFLISTSRTNILFIYSFLNGKTHHSETSGNLWWSMTHSKQKVINMSSKLDVFRYEINMSCYSCTEEYRIFYSLSEIFFSLLCKLWYSLHSIFVNCTTLIFHNTPIFICLKVIHYTEFNTSTYRELILSLNNCW